MISYSVLVLSFVTLSIQWVQQGGTTCGDIALPNFSDLLILSTAAVEVYNFSISVSSSLPPGAPNFTDFCNLTVAVSHGTDAVWEYIWLPLSRYGRFAVQGGGGLTLNNTINPQTGVRAVQEPGQWNNDLIFNIAYRMIHEAATIGKAAMIFVDCSASNPFGRQGRPTTAEQKALYDFGTEIDPVAIAQEALLLTYYIPQENPKFQSFWLGVAIQQAKEARAHDNRAYDGLPQEHVVQLRRLWWNCILRDRSLSLGLRRPLQIPRTAMMTSPPRLEEQDFESELLASRCYSPSIKRSWMHWLILHCQLAIHLTDVLEISYPAWGAGPFAELEQDEIERSAMQLQAGEYQLDKWYAKASRAKAATHGDVTAECLLVSQSMAYLYYYSAKIAIYNQLVRHSILQPRFGSLKATDPNRTILRLQEAIHGITQNLTKLMKADILEQLPPAATALTSFSLVWSVVGSRLWPHCAESDTLRERAEICSKTMQICQTKYEGTDALLGNVSSLIEQITQKILCSNSINLASVSQPGRLLQGGVNGRMVRARTCGLEDLLRVEPRIYSRIVAALDISLSYGRMPQHDEFRTLLRISPTITRPMLAGNSLQAPKMKSRSETSSFLDGATTTRLLGPILEEPDIANSEDSSAEATLASLSQQQPGDLELL